jgi:hypothetical protein
VASVQRPMTAAASERQRLLQVRTLVAILFSLILAVMGTACSGARHPTLAELRRVPGATLTYPNATVFRSVGTEPSDGVDGGDPAYLKVAACAGIDDNTLVSSFAKQLAASGWSPAPGKQGVSDANSYTAAYAWRMGQRNFELRLMTPRYADVVAKETGHPAGCSGGYESVSQ